MLLPHLFNAVFLTVVFGSFVLGFIFKPSALAIVSILYIVLWINGFRLLNKPGHQGSGSLGFAFFCAINAIGLLFSWLMTGLIEHETVYAFFTNVWNYLITFTRL